MRDIPDWKVELYDRFIKERQLPQPIEVGDCKSSS